MKETEAMRAVSACVREEGEPLTEGRRWPQELRYEAEAEDGEKLSPSGAKSTPADR